MSENSDERLRQMLQVVEGCHQRTNVMNQVPDSVVHIVVRQSSMTILLGATRNAGRTEETLQMTSYLAQGTTL